jgi:hypothetical protein
VSFLLRSLAFVATKDEGIIDTDQAARRNIAEQDEVCATLPPPVGLEPRANQARRQAQGEQRLTLEHFHREWKRRNNPSLRGAQRRSNPLPAERTSARQAGDCFGASASQ